MFKFQVCIYTQGRALFSPFEARTLSWVQINRDLYETAWQMVANEART